jgi:hypothetical protein
MKLTRRTVIDLADAHISLEQSSERTFKFSGKTRYKIAKNTRILRGVSQDISKKRDEFIFKHSPTGKIEQGTPERTAFTEEYSAYLDESVDVNVLTYNLDELDLDTNQIPNSVLPGLLDLVLEQVPAL